jgi:hypothetical protein
MTMLRTLQQTVSRWFDDQRKRRQLQRELMQLDAVGSLDAVLADAGLARSQIEPLIAGCAGSKELLDHMLIRLGIDPARLPVESMREVTWTCTTCRDKRQCREWLSGTEETEFRAFCPNTAQLDYALLKQHPEPAWRDAASSRAVRRARAALDGRP